MLPHQAGNNAPSNITVPEATSKSSNDKKRPVFLPAHKTKELANSLSTAQASRMLSRGSLRRNAQSLIRLLKVPGEVRMSETMI